MDRRSGREEVVVAAVDLHGGLWRVKLERAGDEATQTRDLNYAGMLALLLAPIGPLLNRNQSATIIAFREGQPRIELRVLAVQPGASEPGGSERG